jgi:hypothetical protein
MRGLKRSPWLFGLGVLLAVLVVYGGHARAEVTTDQSASIIIFPKVIVDGSRDTIIQITNTDNLSANADCVYINTSGTCSITTSQTCNIDTDCPAGPPAEVCVHQCQEENFSIFLTGQQPTYWDAALGRSNFDGPGLSPGLIKFLASCVGGSEPPGTPCAFPSDCPGGTCSSVAAPFVGELKCIEVDGSGALIAQNSLKGEAIIGGPTNGDLSEYNAIGIWAAVAPAGNTIVLDQLSGVCSGGTNDGNACFVQVECPGGTCNPAPNVGYNACPMALYMNHSGEGAVDSFTGGTVNTELSLVPCSELLEQQTPVHAGAVFRITTEMEQSVSCSVPFDCQLNARLGDLADYGCNFSVGLLGGENLKTRIRPPTGGICYSGSARCHICTDPDDIICIDEGLSLGQIAGNCDCASDADCPDSVMATGSGTCTLTSPHTCSVNTDCDGTTGCVPGTCTCPAGTCLLYPPPACTTTVDCTTGQTCTGAVSLGCRQWPGLLGVAEEFQTPTSGTAGTAAVNLHMEGSRPGDVIVVPQQ